MYYMEEEFISYYKIYWDRNLDSIIVVDERHYTTQENLHNINDFDNNKLTQFNIKGTSKKEAINNFMKMYKEYKEKK